MKKVRDDGRAVARTSLRAPGLDGQGLIGAFRPHTAGRTLNGAAISGTAGPGTPR
ncbi:hypothetical protein FHU13_003071 [Methylobacterium sp. R2-1]|nr:hypothetical protein [Methylobacterium sp. R2-1]